MNKLLITLTGLVAACVLLGLAAANVATADASTRDKLTIEPVYNPSVAKVRALLARYASGQHARKQDADVALFVLDFTERYAHTSKARCGFDARGVEINADGHWYEADLVGKTMKDIGDARSQASAKFKLSYHNGLCYLRTSGQDVYSQQQAFAGATRRTALALSKMLGETVELRDNTGKVVGVYRWSNKW